MKIQKLTIHNIASIEEAEIDFSAKPLVDSDVFLITGKTGAGKSTILDAICLALYNKTPRLYNTRMQGAVNDAGKEVQLDDPAQLLRENTGEGFVRLSFEGSDGIPYEAEWSIARARNKPSGRLQGRKWNVKDLQSGTQYTKVDEIGAVIAAAVKLNFEQFCRTTMLAQGEFTRFLNSKDEEKAEILEMITGAGIYSKIGAKVYEITQRKKSAYDAAKSAVEGIHLLTDDEKNEKLESIEENTRQSKEAETLRNEATKKKTWLETLATLKKNEDDAENALSEAIEANNANEAKAERELIASYRQTETVRSQLANAISEGKAAAGAKSRIDALAEDYVTVRGGEAFLLDKKENLVAELEEVKTALENDAPMSLVLEKAQTLDTYAKNIVDGRGEITTLDGNISLKEKEISETLEPARKTASENHFGKVTARESTQKAVTDAEAALKKTNLEAVRNETRALIQEKGLIGVALERIKSLKEAQKQRREEKDAIDAKAKELQVKAASRDTLKFTVTDLKDALESAKGLFDAANRASDTFVIGLRRKLSVGDVCPVCFSKIEKDLPTDEEVEARLRPLEEAYEKAKKAYDGKNAELVQAEADLTAEQKALTSRKGNFEKDKTLSTRLSEVLSALKDCGYETLEDNTRETLQQRIGAINVRQGELSTLETEGKALEKALETARTNDRAAEKDVEKAQKELDAAKEALEKATGEVSTWKALKESKIDSIQKALTAAQEILKDTVWAGSWQDDIPTFRRTLQDAVVSHNANLKKQTDLTALVNTVSNELRSIATAIATVHTLKPEWKDKEYGEPVEVEDLLGKAESLRDDLIAENRTFTEASKKAREAERQVEGYIREHPELDKDKLVALSAYSSEDISRRDSAQKALSDALVSAKTTRDNAKEEVNTHLAEKPELSEDNTVESLAIVANEANQRVLDIAATIGAVNKELEDDKKNRETVGELVKESDARMAEYIRWNRLNDMIGDQTGKKFRKIAQSYVLGSLVSAANHYMHDLTDRYVLKVEPGTFIITLEDAYQGFVSRAASTISGGESFLVSLSLALALSDIGDTLSVDTLFIDEGFGTLSGEPLQNAVNTLKTLRTKAGRHVGIISHIEELQEKIPVRIQVEQNERTGSSKVRVVAEE